MTTTIIILAGSAVCGVATMLVIIGLLPIFYALAVTKEQMEKEQIANALKVARTRKIEADRDVLNSRRALIDSNVALKELQMEAQRRKLGYLPDESEKKFTPTNYEADHY